MKDFTGPYLKTRTRIATQPSLRETLMGVCQPIQALLHREHSIGLVSEVFAQQVLPGIDQSRFLDHEPSIDPTHLAPTTHTPKTTTIIDWRYEICHFLQLDPNASDDEVFGELQTASAKLKEAERVKHQSKMHRGPPRYQVIHGVFCESSKTHVMYLEQPWTVHGGRGRFHLRGSKQVSNMELYLERNKDVCFLVLREYTCCRERSHTHRYHLGRDLDAQPESMMIGERINIVSDDLQSRLASLSKVAFQGIPHPKFGLLQENENDTGNNYNGDDDDDDVESGSYVFEDNLDICYPYLWFYHRRLKISEAIESLAEIDRAHLNIFCGYIQSRMSEEWSAVDSLISKGEITAEYIRYIYVSLLTRIVFLAPDHLRSQERLFSWHQKTPPKSSYRLTQ